MPNLFARPGFRKYFANTSWLLGERVLRMVVSLLVGIYVARYLGPERFGLLSYELSFVMQNNNYL
jgi:O-antigen/teichoic acid export membrane protein